MTGAFLAPAFDVPPTLLETARNIRLVLFDIDGVLTDGRLVFDDDGREYKAFHSRDGHGIKLLQRTGVAVGVISGRASKAVEHRVRELGIAHVYQNCSEKLAPCRALLAELGLAFSQAAFVGDDVVDLPVMLQVGLALAVQDAHWLVKHHAHWVTPSGGGRGAVREVCELIMHAHGTYTAALQDHLRGDPRLRSQTNT